MLSNDRASQSIEAHSCRSLWQGTGIVHKREYLRKDSQGSDVTLEATDELVRVIVFYPALVRVVELHVGGRMMQGDASELTKGGWTFKVAPNERIRAIASALVERDHLSRGLSVRKDLGSGVVAEPAHNKNIDLRT